VGTILNKDEKRALIKFLSVYIISSMLLVGTIGFLYYNKEVVSIDDQCSIAMTNAAMMIEKDLMNAKMKGEAYKFKIPKENLNAALFDENGKAIYSTLESNKVYLSKKAYTNNIHQYHIHSLDKPLFGIKYIALESNIVQKEKIKLLAKIGTIIFIVTIFLGFVGYYLSRLLISPIKSKVEQLNSFIKDSAHDINTPVSALMMSISSIRGKEKIDQKVMKHISISAKLISQIYNSLSFLAFNEHDKYLNEEFDLADTIQESVRFFDEIAASKGNTISCKLESTKVYMDKSRIQKVINNLLSNALKYSYPKTNIEIVLEDRVLSIKDEGIGISKEDIESIFDRYERKAKDQGGFGIGLDIVKSVCDFYGIKISVESEISKGSIFYLRFPKAG